MASTSRWRLCYACARRFTLPGSTAGRRQLQKLSDVHLEIDTKGVGPSTPGYKPSATIVGDSTANATSSPAKLHETATATSPQAELFPPNTPQLAVQPASEATKSAADLFPTTTPAEERVAGRGDGPTQIINHTMTTPSGSSGPATAASAPPIGPPAPTAPTMEPSYPTTSYPSTGLPVSNYPTTNPSTPTYPVTSFPPNYSPAVQPPLSQQPPSYQPSPYLPPQIQPPQFQAPQFQPPVQQPYPTSDYRSAFASPPVPNAVSPQATWSPPPSGTPNYPVNSAPGTRYERSGSSLYQGLR